MGRSAYAKVKTSDEAVKWLATNARWRPGLSDNTEVRVTHAGRKLEILKAQVRTVGSEGQTKLAWSPHAAPEGVTIRKTNRGHS